MAPVALSSASTSVVFPAPEWPTSTTLRTPPGWSAGAAPPVAVDPLLSVIIASCGSIRLLSPVAANACPAGAPVRLHYDQPLPLGYRTTSPRPESRSPSWRHQGASHG